jgi:plasmid stability protein
MKRDVHYVYWYHLDTHTDPIMEGYVGVTNWLTRRRYQHSLPGKGSHHLRNALAKYGDRVKMAILLETRDRNEALLEELYYRPVPNMGWNILPGGGDTPDCRGRRHSAETRRKIGEAGKRTKAMRPTAPSKFKGQADRWSDEQKLKIGIAHKGKTISAAHRQAITEKMSGEGSPKAKAIALVHKDNPAEVKHYPCIKSAADALGLGYQALRSLFQRSQIDSESKGPNRAGWVVLHPIDISCPERTVTARIALQQQRLQEGVALREAKRAEQKVLSSDQD